MVGQYVMVVMGHLIYVIGSCKVAMHRGISLKLNYLIYGDALLQVTIIGLYHLLILIYLNGFPLMGLKAVMKVNVC